MNLKDHLQELVAARRYKGWNIDVQFGDHQSIERLLLDSQIQIVEHLINSTDLADFPKEEVDHRFKDIIPCDGGWLKGVRYLEYPTMANSLESCDRERQAMARENPNVRVSRISNILISGQWYLRVEAPR